jgi:hypothetical protein
VNKQTKPPSVEDALQEIDATRNGLAKLREPFPPNQVSKLPKETKRQIEERKAGNNVEWKCAVCGGMHHKNAVHLDYVGHAALTDRLLDVDPEWSWEPMGYTAEGLPAIGNGGLWIKLTVCGVSRFGFGAADGKSGGDAIKEMIGDALRNAAMRFGAALELWHKGDLHADDPDESAEPTPKPNPTPETKPINDGQKFDITALSKQADVSIQTICETANVSEIAELSEAKAASIIKKLRLTIEKKKPAAMESAGDILDDDIPY